MILISLELDSRGLLAACEVSGHATALRQSGSVPCAAVSALVRTAARLIEARDGVHYGGGVHEAGELSIRIQGVQRRQHRWLQGVTDYLVAGAQDVEREYPDDCKVEIQVKE